MNESSSKFVDNLAMEKLLNEKLKKVSHSPQYSFFMPGEGLFNRSGKSLNLWKVNDVKTSNRAMRFEISSFERSQYYSENDTVYLYYHPAQNANYNILLLHGLFDDNMLNYAFLIKLLNELNFNVYFMTLPYHFDRKPGTSLFSGEFFLSADIYRSQSAFRQAVYDIEASFQFIKNHNSLKSILVGFSMGGCVSFRYHLLNKQDVGTFLVNPVTDLSRIIFDNPLMITVGMDLRKSGFDLNTCEKIFMELDPCKNISMDFSGERIAMVYSKYDQIIEESKYKIFLNETGIKRAYAYNAGHLNILRVPRLSRDIYDFVGMLDL